MSFFIGSDPERLRICSSLFIIVPIELDFDSLYGTLIFTVGIRNVVPIDLSRNGCFELIGTNPLYLNGVNLSVVIVEKG